MKPCKILFVCTGNICRSPVAEAVMRQLVQRAGLDHRIVVDSAGIQSYHAGHTPDPRSVAEAVRRGYHMGGPVARQVKPADFENFDLILAMDKGHLRALREASPDAFKANIKLFSTESVPDPYYGEEADFVHVMDLIEAGAERLIKDLVRKIPR